MFGPIQSEFFIANLYIIYNTQYILKPSLVANHCGMIQSGCRYDTYIQWCFYIVKFMTRDRYIANIYVSNQLPLYLLTYLVGSSSSTWIGLDWIGLVCWKQKSVFPGTVEPGTWQVCTVLYVCMRYGRGRYIYLELSSLFSFLGFLVLNKRVEEG